jgi:hypothetical protein
VPVPATLTERRVTLSAELRRLSLNPSDANPRDDANNPSGAKGRSNRLALPRPRPQPGIARPYWERGYN